MTVELYTIRRKSVHGHFKIACGLMVRAQCTVRVRVRARVGKWVLFFPAL